jgi:hypothetical protein
MVGERDYLCRYCLMSASQGSFIMIVLGISMIMLNKENKNVTKNGKLFIIVGLGLILTDLLF